MKEITQMQFCENCEKETEHIVRESTLEIEYLCKNCNKHEEMVKTFF